MEHQAFENLEKKSLETITIHRDSLVWVKQGKEILYQRELFDIKQITKVGDSIIILGLKDTKEMELHALRDRVHSPWSTDNKIVQEQVHKLVWTNQMSVVCLNITLLKAEGQTFFSYKSLLQSGINETIYSPPQFI